MSPHVSVVIPTYNRSRLLKEAVASCYRSGAGLVLEIIVVDDASTENIVEALEGFDIRYIRLQQNSRSAIARNQGKALATGEYVKFLDSDDVLVDGSLSKEYSLARETGAEMVVSGWQDVALHENGIEHPLAKAAPPVFLNIVDDLLAGKAVPTSAVLYKRELIEKVDWDKDLPKLNDWDYFVSAALVSKNIVSAKTCAYLWRHHSGERITSSATFLMNAMSFFRVLGKMEDSLRSMGAMTENRRKRLAQYLYKELRGAYRFDSKLARNILKKIQELDPGFYPRDEERSRILRWLCRLFPIDPVLSAYGMVRRVVDGMKVKHRKVDQPAADQG